MSNLHEPNAPSTIEFEAPLSTDASSAAAKRHFSIDLSLELERQLDMESYPPTPSHYTEAPTLRNGAHRSSKHESLDPHVLAHIIKQLRQSLADVTKDRDELLEMVAVAATHESELKDALDHMTDKATKMEVELSDARNKIKDDEEAITLLRSKVEESRRGLMRLQTENRRHSLAPGALDLSRAGYSMFSSPPSSKRASFTPLTGTFTGRSNAPRATSDSGFDTSPRSQLLALQDNAPPPTSKAARRQSALFGRPLPPQPDMAAQPDLHLTSEIEALRRDLSVVREELEHTKHELQETIEAKEASDICVKALRDFIDQNNVGTAEQSKTLPPLSLPLPSTLSKGDGEEERKTAGGASAWGFKLWRDATQRTPTVPQSASMASPAVAPPQPAAPASATPLSRKIGGFFSSRSSISSISSSVTAATPNNPSTPNLPQLQTNAAKSVRDSMYSSSDASSLAEPISPSNEVSNHTVVVRDVTNLSVVGSTEPSPDAGKRHHVEASQEIVIT